ncbi:MAG: DUF4111 domain-containing protein [Candidatus Levybacteria bacterium]|nr:DUF4111 domain-containing protein [Candidatus Levybacteria bacterium]
MQPTSYEEVNSLIQLLLSQIKDILGEKMIGLYLYGSLVTGDFDIKISDIDLLCAVSSDVDSHEFEKLKQMHEDFAKTHKAWNDRIEVQYLSIDGLKTFKSRTTKMVDISPGEPIHILDAGKEWLVNWYMVQEKGLTLFGASSKTIIDPISKDEFIETVREHTKIWRTKDIPKRRGSQAYAILTLCRAYYTLKHGEQVPKREAAVFIQKEFPEWKSLIDDALQWRDEQWKTQAEDETVYPQTVKFVNFMIDQI